MATMRNLSNVSISDLNKPVPHSPASTNIITWVAVGLIVIAGIAYYIYRRRNRGLAQKATGLNIKYKYLLEQYDDISNKNYKTENELLILKKHQNETDKFLSQLNDYVKKMIDDNTQKTNNYENINKS